MAYPEIVSPEVWHRAQQQLLTKEKVATRARDALAAERRRMPAMQVADKYRFTGLNGECALPDLFEGYSQLIIYHHMLQPGDTAPCAGCSMFVDNLGHRAHLNARDTTLALVSNAPIDEIEVFRQRMGWHIPWYSSSDSFSQDMGVGDEFSFGLNVFLRRDSQILRTYFTSGRGVEALGSNWTLLDLTPSGRQEFWEDSPDSVAQTDPYQWWRLHDEY